MKYKMLLVKMLILLLPLPGYNQNTIEELAKERDKAFARYMDSISSDPSTKSLRNALKDSVQKWINNKVKYIMYVGKSKWRIEDAVFYNEKRDKAILFILFQSPDTNARFDYSKAIGAEKIKGSWRFYYASYVLLASDRKKRQPVSFENLSRRARFRMVSDGFMRCIVKSGCTVNYTYIESSDWFADWLREKHILFLTNKLPEPEFERAEDGPH